MRSPLTSPGPGGMSVSNSDIRVVREGCPSPGSSRVKGKTVKMTTIFFSDDTLTESFSGRNLFRYSPQPNHVQWTGGDLVRDPRSSRLKKTTGYNPGSSRKRGGFRVPDFYRPFTTGCPSPSGYWSSPVSTTLPSWGPRHPPRESCVTPVRYIWTASGQCPSLAWRRKGLL